MVAPGSGHSAPAATRARTSPRLRNRGASVIGLGNGAALLQIAHRRLGPDVPPHAILTSTGCTLTRLSRPQLFPRVRDRARHTEISMTAEFPDDVGADTFLSGFARAAAPSDPRHLMHKLPLLVLQITNDEHYDSRVRQVARALRETVGQPGKRVPSALVEVGGSGPGTTTQLVSERVGDDIKSDLPRNMTPDRFDQFELLREVIRTVLPMDGPVPARAPAAAELRDRAYLRRVERGGLLGLLWTLSIPAVAPAGNGLLEFVLQILWRPLTQSLPRQCWTWRMTRKFIRPVRLPGWRGRRRWLGEQEQVDNNVFEVLTNLLQREIHRLQDPGGVSYATSVETLERLLLRGLLEDLSDPRVGRVRPRRRRRTARPVILLHLPHDHAAASQIDRFLSLFHEGWVDAPTPGPLVIAVGQPSPALVARIGPFRQTDLQSAGELLQKTEGQTADSDAVAISISGQGFQSQGIKVSLIRPRVFRLHWKVIDMLLVCVLLLGCIAGEMIITRSDESPVCVGGAATVAASAPSTQVATDPIGWYDAAIRSIQQENDVAIEFSRRGRTVRTIVAFVSNRPTNSLDTIFDGTIPELRGIALWQHKLNQDANADQNQVPLLVDVRNTGPAFRDARQKAQELADEVKAWKPSADDTEDYKQIIGVLGYAQSRDETRQALEVLDSAGLLVIGTTATADEMLGPSSYWPLTPVNSREASIAAEFTTSQRIIARHGSSGECNRARRALIIENHGDLYSRSLAERFRKIFRGDTTQISFVQDGSGRPGTPSGIVTYSSAVDVADRVCREVSERPDTVVYWSSRARDFTAFVEKFDTQGTCTAKNITVLGGNELTNVAQTGVFRHKKWLRLYYSAHRIPAGDERASDATRAFLTDYTTFVDTTTSGPDPWTNDGHSAVSYDAFHVLSRIADITYGKNATAAPSDMRRFFLNSSIAFNGATGYIEYATGVNQPPVDKTLVLLYQTGSSQEAVVVCGAYDQDQSSTSQEPPCPSAPVG